MEENKKAIILKKIEKTLKNLEKNNMKGFYVDKKENVFHFLISLIKENDTIGFGGSVTLDECGVLEALRNEKYQLYDRSVPGLTGEEIREIYIKSIGADVYLSSTNALTENGELYNVDGNSNRIAAIAFGPKSVILIAGYNKIVRNIDEAFIRMKTIAAPANATRLKKDTYCTSMGECIAANCDDICGGCDSAQRICRNHLISTKQGIKDRIKVIIVGEELGY